MIHWPSAVVSALSRNRAVLFIGAGISAGSRDAEGKRPPAWGGLLDTAAKKCTTVQRRVRALIRAGDLLTACELISGDLAEDWREFLKQQFLIKYNHNKNHEHIHNLGQQIVITPNFDKIYDIYASNQSDPVVVKWARDHDIVSDLRMGRRIILKVHGTIDHPESIIITRSEYARSRIKDYAFFKVVDSLLLINTTIFLGCGLSDPDVQLILETQALRHTPDQPHYFVTSERLTDQEKAILKSTRGLRVITYNSRNNHAELTEGLAALAEKVSIERKSFLARQIERESSAPNYSIIDIG
ncbi:SIR2 family protein [Corallococcus macrosporus]|uniref:Sir2-like protein n=1 Tax=Corallococcus macrosporus DSM 14697 TaxID=1189310 RepID=A0A250JY15_9BACT|nr:SIR2 family protein [Corallococcus macrosporus]ATB48759.1 Sir2-like protein [Corallococcus macrosporus DSM 14697]